MNRKPRKILEGSAGQATVEFALTMILLMAVVLFNTQLSLVFGFGNFVHYATFMSARAYSSASESQADQAERARNVITRMLKRRNSPAVDRFPSIAKGVDGADAGDGQVTGFYVDPPTQYKQFDKDLSWMEGVRYKFRSKVFLLPIGSNAGASSVKNSVTLQSESWLGREPTFEECKAYLKTVGGKFDNGC